MSLTSGIKALELSGGVEPVEERHGDVEHDDVGPELLRGLQQGAAIAHGPHDLATGLEQMREGLPEQPVVVGQQDTRSLHRSLTRDRAATSYYQKLNCKFALIYNFSS